MGASKYYEGNIRTIYIVCDIELIHPSIPFSDAKIQALDVASRSGRHKFHQLERKFIHGIKSIEKRLKYE